MAKAREKLDGQMRFPFDRRIEEYRQIKEEILSAPVTKRIESHEEGCIEIAAAIKRAVRSSGMSREQMVDAVNEYFGWGPKSPKKLTIHMFNHYLSKPVQYPIPSFYLFAIQRLTDSLEPTSALADAEGAKVISGDEVRQMALGKLDDSIIQMQRLKKQLRGGK